MSIPMRSLPSLEQDELLEVVLGRRKDLPRGRAMSALVRSGNPDREKILAKILAKRREPSTFRYLAAVNLGKIGTSRAEQALIRHAQVEDERVLLGVVRSLGRFGGEKSLAAVLDVARSSDGFLAERARFAATLISHRLRRPDETLRPRFDGRLLPLLPSQGIQSEIRKARPALVARCLDDLAQDPVGVELSSKAVFEFRGAPCRLVIVYNREFGSKMGLATLSTYPGIVGVVASFFEDTGAYARLLLILATPTGESDRIQLTLHHSNGDIALLGQAINGEFSLRAVDRPGAVATVLEGRFDGTTMKMSEAYVDRLVRRRRSPEKDPF